MEYEDELFFIRKKPLECERDGKPVFLYGKDSIDRKTMVEEVAKEISSRSKYIDCSSMSGNDVYDNLAKPRILFGWAGLLFVDNLICEDHEDDTEAYRKLAKIIMKRKKEIDEDELEGGDNYEDCRKAEDPKLYHHIYLKLLVVYSEKYESFPKYFQRQFEKILLECESEPIGPIEIDRKRQSLKFNNKVVELEPRQIELFEFLYEHKDKVKSRYDISKELWPEHHKTSIYGFPDKDILDQQVHKLRKGLIKLGFKKEILETYKKTQLFEGGFEFHSKLTSFLE